LESAEFRRLLGRNVFHDDIEELANLDEPQIVTYVTTVTVRTGSMISFSQLKPPQLGKI
jgi:hypothetical protein